MKTVDDLKNIVHDVTDLCELQLQLLAIDSKAAMSRAVVAVTAIGLALVVGLSAFTSILLAGGWALHEYFEWSISAGLLTSGIIGLFFALILGLIGHRALKRTTSALNETRQEFANNIGWLKSLLKNDVSHTPGHGRPDLNDSFTRTSTDRVF